MATSTWDTSKVTTMAQMFYQASKFNNASGISGWKTGNVTTMNPDVQLRSLFNRSLAYNASTNAWNTGKVQDFSYMFQYNPAFNQPINSWTSLRQQTCRACSKALQHSPKT